MDSIHSVIDFSRPSLWISIATILLNPTFWNIAARSEYHNNTITRLFGDPYRGCYALAITIFSLGVIRDHFYQTALAQQPFHPLLTPPPSKLPWLDFNALKLASVTLIASGTTLVLTSMWALGVTGTYLGDYFGILMDEMVTGFPFNVTGAPMYVGSTLSFLGTALWYGKPAGVVLTALVWACYSVALRFEDPFTAGIYEKREKERAQGKAEGKKEL